MAGQVQLQPFVSALCLVLLSSLLPPSTAKTMTTTVTSDDRPVLPIQSFTYRGTGHVTISASGVSVVSRSAAAAAKDPSRLGFVLISREQVMLWQSRSRGDGHGRPKCLLRSPYVQTLFTFLELLPPPRSSFKSSYPITVPGEYSLLFVNCLPSNPRVSMKVRAEFHNVPHHRSSRSYLSPDQEWLIPIFACFSLTYFALLFTWIRLCFDKKRSVLRIHWLMFALLLIKGLDLLNSAVAKHSVKVFGIPPPGSYFISRTLYYYLFYTIEALIFVGLWKSKSALHPKLRIVTLLMVAVQIIANVALFSLGDERTQSFHEFKKWNSMFVLTNLGCFIPVVASAIVTIRSLKEASEADEKGATSKLSEMRKLLGIYVAGMGYLHLFYLFVFPLHKAVTVSKGTTTFVEEGAHLMLCAIMLYVFRPEAKDEHEYRSIEEVERPLEDDRGTAAEQGESEKI